jgi:hypothetical protein
VTGVAVGQGGSAVPARLLLRKRRFAAGLRCSEFFHDFSPARVDRPKTGA